MRLRTTGNFVTKELQGTDTLRWFNKQTPPSQHAAVSALKGTPKSSTGARSLSESIIFFCSCISFRVTALGCSCRAFHLLQLHPAKLLPSAMLLLQQRGGLCWHPPRCKSWHQGPYLCIFQGDQQVKPVQRVPGGTSHCWEKTTSLRGALCIWQ